jgi:hypothetical protein
VALKGGTATAPDDIVGAVANSILNVSLDGVVGVTLGMVYTALDEVESPAVDDIGYLAPFEVGSPVRDGVEVPVAGRDVVMDAT